MKIVVLDGYTLNPGDLSWDSLSELGECEFHDRTDKNDIITRSQGADVLMTNKTPLSSETIGQLPDLKFIGVLATGYNIVDIDAAAARRIPVSNVPTYGSESVAQMVFAHILNLNNRVAEHDRSVKNGDWSRSADWCYWNYPLFELAGRTLGIVGYGRIGRAVSRLGLAFGMKIQAFDPFVTESDDERVTMETDLEGLFRDSDFISLHAPLTKENEGFINAGLLSRMKKTACLINTSRGLLVNEADLAKALDDGVIAGAGLDVLNVEPPAADNPLFKAKNCFLTPHISWATYEARSRLLNIAVDNVKAFLSGNPANVVNDIN